MESLTLTAIISLAVSAAVSGLIAYLYQRKLIEVQFEFNRKLSEINFQTDYRLKASIVAEMFSIWHQGRYSTSVQTPEDFKKINKLCWECSFWLDNEIIVDINNRLQNHAGAKDLKEIITDVRQYLNPELEEIDWRNITHF